MILELVGIQKTYTLGREKIDALNGVDLALEKGEFATVIGSNGAGKSTLLNVIAGTTQPNAGRVRIVGRDITTWPAHRRARWIGRVFQDPLQGTAAGMTVAENLALARKKGRRGLRRALPARWLSTVREELAGLNMDLANRLTEQVGHLSGGERQALTVLMATLSRPVLLLLDEHTAALDPANAEHVLAITQQLARAGGMATLMVTHRMDQALTMGDRLIMLHAGEIMLEAAGEAKSSLGVADLVRLFRRQGVSDDTLLLETTEKTRS